MLHGSGQGVKTAVHFAQQDSVLSPSLRDAEQTLSLLVTPKLKCNSKAGAAAAPARPAGAQAGSAGW